MLDFSKIDINCRKKDLKITDVYGFRTDVGIYITNDEDDMIFFNFLERKIETCKYDCEIIEELCEHFGEILLKIYYHSEDLKIAIEEN